MRILARDEGVCQCEDCKATGRVRIASEVDHKVNKATWRRLHGSLKGVNAESNLQAMHTDCHALKTQQEAQEARAAARAATRGG